ncbi:hypothetical protein NJB25_03170 [Escherichia fergusonii]|uniref:hypothetical protein n=1 Tax=Escherichia fergusonii TaxID=564 RepID=UPI0015D8F08C|nr:hypothetical protein [Escherichia fergusonii]MBZ4076258.1 hypothetical protein [Escherichia fergusonii]MBZ4106550.1 hypothetical protein [Escherichia fergusonii]MBZ4112397.1 hypothetical protein [Escherichia fergusonii]MBZ4121250.1 hypothetical protein [Escherichia fergusonii]MBZ4124704.1 hypothetical protein [Escherichia fergusonii]
MMKRLLALVISIFFISACSSAIEKTANNGITFSNTATSVTPTKAFPMRPDYDPWDTNPTPTPSPKPPKPEPKEPTEPKPTPKPKSYENHFLLDNETQRNNSLINIQQNNDKLINPGQQMLENNGGY